MPTTAGPGQALRLTEAELSAWGQRFGRECRAPLVVTLDGDLGAGKTTLAKAICRGFGVTGEVTSPTFALVHEYEAPSAPVFHLDLYRLESARELTNLGWDEIVYDRALVLIEWPDRAGDRVPADVVRLHLAHIPGDPALRELRVDGSGQGRPG